MKYIKMIFLLGICLMVLIIHLCIAQMFFIINPF